MLVSLHVKNLALIDETEVFFEPGLNILTGETGAGKSVLIGSINLALGAKADKDMLRTGTESALVELLFESEDPAVAEKLEEFDIPAEEVISISRRIQPGRSICRINGETVSAKQVRELAERLIDIHGQHEHQSLLRVGKHLEILDSYAGEKLEELKEKIKNAYRKLQKLREEMAETGLDEEEKKRQISLAEFECREIEEAQLQSGEDEELEQRYRRMSHARRIAEGVSACYAISGYESGEGAGVLLGRALKELRGVTGYDETLIQLEEQLGEVENLLNDFNRSVADYLSDLEFDRRDFELVEERLNQINHLKGKYGNSVTGILEYLQNQQEKLLKLADYDAYMEELKEKEKKQYEELEGLCRRASDIRKKEAKTLSAKLRQALEELNFLSVQFEIDVRQKDKPGPDGMDEAEFLISTNPGEKIKPLGQVASGGELSRIMLAVKTVLAQEDAINTLIFDEIDAGISGKTAWQVSKKLGLLGKTHQVICITHLPQIAAMAKTHYKIEKNSNGISTATEIEKLNEKESIRETARLLGGETITQAALTNAEEMKKMAEDACK